LAIPFWQHREVTKVLPSREGKTVIDSTNANRFDRRIADGRSVDRSGRIKSGRRNFLHFRDDL